VEKRQLRGYMTEYRYDSISTPERIPLTEQFLRRKKIVFLDRDGVINKKAPKADYVKRWEEFIFLPGSIEAINLLVRNGYKIFIITNQAGIARGMMTEEDLNTIHENMKKELEKHNIKISGIYHCPHGWNDGCECRKPKPGMFHQAARDHHINLTKALFIGDDERDMEAGTAAGIESFLISPENDLLDVTKSIIEGE
jgi:D-glycero-D-manno-heptose 1,7-bisphosphate phosphatase